MLLAPYEVDGAQVVTDSTTARDRYQALVDQYGIPFGRDAPASVPKAIRPAHFPRG